MSVQETVEVPVTVFAGTPMPGGVEVKLSAEGPVEIASGETRRISFPEAGEGLVRFRVKTKSAIGNVKLKIAVPKRVKPRIIGKTVTIEKIEDETGATFRYVATGR